MIYFKKLIVSALDHQASYLYLIPNHPPVLRKCGKIEFLKIASLTSIEIEEIIQNIITSDQYIIYKNQGYCHLYLDFDNDNTLEIYILFQEYDSEVTVHILKKKKSYALESDILEKIDHVICFNRGLLLVTGPSYNGQMITSTPVVGSIVQQINSSHKKNIIIFEHDKMISSYKSDNSLVRSYSLAQASLSFINSQGADVVIFSDCSDINMINTAIHCVETGHLVIILIDSISVEFAIDRIARLFSTRELGLSLILSHLTAVILQVLVKKNNDFDSISVSDFIFMNDDMKYLIKKDNTAQFYVQILDKLTKLIEQGIVDYESSKSIIGQFRGFDDMYTTYDRNNNLF